MQLNSRLIVFSLMLLLGGGALTYGLFHDAWEKQPTYYGPNDRMMISFGAVTGSLALLLLVSERLGLHRRGVLGARVRAFDALAVGAFVALAGVATGMFLFHQTSGDESYQNKEFAIGIYQAPQEAPLQFSGAGIKNPVLTRNSMPDLEIRCVADPFLVSEGDSLYLFYEALEAVTGQGVIAVATSADGKVWEYKAIVLDEPFHLSYPCVFKWEGRYYMIPEAATTRSVRLYRAVKFPYRWEFVKKLIDQDDKLFKDNTIFEYGGRWWLFSETMGNRVLRLYYAHTPLGPWTEHPKSPVVNGNPEIARPGGSVVEMGGHLYRFAQDDAKYYGRQVWAIEITKLSPTEYEEKKLRSRPVLKGFEPWNRRGMHHLCPIKTPDGWIAAVDGY
ncbi:MAG: hypothetical protein ONB14_03940 [candidate division KSB1 bacterium]|nr:hypothetical protein [candidate division KSB1 bacterium]